MKSFVRGGFTSAGNVVIEIDLAIIEIIVV